MTSFATGHTQNRPKINFCLPFTPFCCYTLYKVFFFVNQFLVSKTILMRPLSLRRKMHNYKKIIILGGGITGLTAAKELSEQYKDKVLVLEKENFLGGLAATLLKDGLRVDLGSHRIHPDYPKEVFDYIRNVLGIELLERPRKGALYIKGKFLHYPPSFMDFVRTFSVKKTMGLAISYTANIFRITKRRRMVNYQEAMIVSVGKRIYTTFYKNFAKKLWGLDPRKISIDGMRRRNVSFNLAFIKKSIFGQNRRFFYPRNGIGEIATKLEDRILYNGAKIIKNANIKGLLLDNGGITKLFVEDGKGNKSEVEVEVVVSTIPICSLFELVYGANKNMPSLQWRGMRIFYLYLKEHLEHESETFYFPELDIRFGRVSDVAKFSPYLNPLLSGTLLTIEIPCTPDEESWKISDDKLLTECLKKFVDIGIFKKEPTALKYFSIWIEKAYPVYDIKWKQNFSLIYDKLKNIDNLFSIGRKGLFLHCNIDHCIIQGRKMAEFIFKMMKLEKEKSLWDETSEKFMQFSARD